MASLKIRQYLTFNRLVVFLSRIKQISWGVFLSKIKNKSRFMFYSRFMLFSSFLYLKNSGGGGGVFSKNIKIFYFSWGNGVDRDTGMSVVVERGGVRVSFWTCWREISGDRVALFIKVLLHLRNGDTENTLSDKTIKARSNRSMTSQKYVNIWRLAWESPTFLWTFKLLMRAQLKANHKIDFIHKTNSTACDRSYLGPIAPHMITWSVNRCIFNLSERGYCNAGVCVYVCVCARTRVRACVRACVRNLMWADCYKTIWHTVFDVMTFMTYYFTLWRVVAWRTYYVMTYFGHRDVLLMSWHTFWRHNILFDVMTYFGHHDILLKVMAYICFLHHA